MARVQFRVAKLHFAHSSPAHYLSKTSCEHLCCLRLVSASLAFDSHSVPSGSSRYIAAAMLSKARYDLHFVELSRSTCWASKYLGAIT